MATLVTSLVPPTNSSAQGQPSLLFLKDDEHEPNIHLLTATGLLQSLSQEPEHIRFLIILSALNSSFSESCLSMSPILFTYVLKRLL